MSVALVETEKHAPIFSSNLFLKIRQRFSHEMGENSQPNWMEIYPDDYCKRSVNSNSRTNWVKIYPDEYCKSSAGRNFTTMGRPSSRTRTAFSLGVCRGGVDVLGLLRKK